VAGTPRQSQLSHDEHVQRRLEGLRHFEGDGNPAPRQPEHDDVAASRELAKPPGQDRTGLATVGIACAER
jgi:hypothetical protein